MHQFKSIFNTVLMISVLLQFGCATVAKQIPMNPNSIQSINTGMIVNYGFNSQAIIGENGCNLKIYQHESGKNFTFDLSPSETALLIELPEGTYSYTQLTCGSVYFTIESDSLFSAFKIFSHKISVVKPFKISIDSNRHLTYLVPNQYETELKSTVFQGLDQTQKARLVSGYTGKNFF